MSKKSPYVQVKEQFGSKKELAEKLAGTLERPYEESDEDFARRVRTMSNKKLLRLHAIQEEVASRFTDKAGLVDAILKLRYPTGKIDPSYKAKLEGYRPSRLLDTHQVLAKKA